MKKKSFWENLPIPSRRAEYGGCGGPQRQLGRLAPFDICRYSHIHITSISTLHVFKPSDLYINDRLTMLYSTMLTSSDLTMSSMTHVVDTKAAPTAPNFTINHFQPQLHAYEMHAHDMYAHDVHGYEVPRPHLHARPPRCRLNTRTSRTG